MIRGALRPLIRGGLRGVIPGVTDEFQALIDSLFGAGEQGLFFVPEPGFRGEDVLYQDEAGTTLADANGDPVGRGDEFSGNDNSLTQPTSADRPLYQTDGTLHWVKGDGAGDIISADLPARDLSSAATIISAAARFDDTSTFRYTVGVSNTGSTNGWAGFRYDSAGFRVTTVDDSGTAVILEAPDKDTAFHVFTCAFDGVGGVAFYVDGVLHDSATIAATTINSLSVHGLRRSIVGSFANSSIAGAVLHTKLGEREQVENFLSSLAGITL